MEAVAVICNSLVFRIFLSKALKFLRFHSIYYLDEETFFLKDEMKYDGRNPQ